MNNAAHFYEFGPFRLDVRQRLQLREGQPISLPPRAMDTLLVLIESCGQILSKDELMQRVWPETFVEEGNLGQNIFLIRKALGVAEEGHDYIKTLPKRGYCFIAEVREVREPNSAVIMTEHTIADVLIEHDISGPESIIGSTAEPENVASATSSKAPLARTSTLWLVAVVLMIAGGVALYLLLSARATQPGQPVFERTEVRKLTSTGGSVEGAISPDGKYVAHVVDDVGSQSLWIRQSATANDIEIVPAAEARYLGLTFSHDSNWIYFVRDSELFLIAALGGAPRKLLSDVDSPVTMS